MVEKASLGELGHSTKANGVPVLDSSNDFYPSQSLWKHGIVTGEQC